MGNIMTSTSTSPCLPCLPCGSTGSILDAPMADIRSAYDFHRVLACGRYGTVHLVSDKETAERYACKSINTVRALPEEVRREVEVLQHVTGHPSIVEMREAVEDRECVHIIMDLCEGGELFDAIMARAPFSERKAAELVRQIVAVIRDCHELGVMHRDIKPENFVFLNPLDDSPALKLVDFGSAVFFKPGETFQELRGSLYYVAPEVIQRHYGSASDIWSIGVILYMLLCAQFPFGGATDQEILRDIQRGIIRYDDPSSVSDSAKDLISKIFRVDPKERISAADILNHPWVRQDGDAPDVPLTDPAIIRRMKNFQAMNKFKRVALKVIAESLSEEEISGLHNIFQSIDTDKDNKISFNELKEGLKNWGKELPDSEVQGLLASVDLDGDGVVEYNDFISAIMHLNRMEKRGRLCSAFLYFDKENKGYITKEEVEEALKQYTTTDEEVLKIIDQIVKDGKITYEDFVAMMRTNDSQIVSNWWLA